MGGEEKRGEQRTVGRVRGRGERAFDRKGGRERKKEKGERERGKGRGEREFLLSLIKEPIVCAFYIQDEWLE